MNDDLYFYAFSPDVAKLVGLPSAVILAYICHEAERNEDGNVHLTVASLRKRFPYFSAKAIKQGLDKLCCNPTKFQESAGKSIDCLANLMPFLVMKLFDDMYCPCRTHPKALRLALLAMYARNDVEAMRLLELRPEYCDLVKDNVDVANN